MSYRVILTPRARIELFRNAAWWAQNRSLDQAATWIEQAESVLSQLTSDSQRWPLAEENDDVPVEIRELHFGIGRTKTHRAVFQIRDDRVVVHSIRHLSQDSLAADDF